MLRPGESGCVSGESDTLGNRRRSGESVSLALGQTHRTHPASTAGEPSSEPTPQTHPQRTHIEALLASLDALDAGARLEVLARLAARLGLRVVER